MGSRNGKPSSSGRATRSPKTGGGRPGGSGGTLFDTTPDDPEEAGFAVFVTWARAVGGGAGEARLLAEPIPAADADAVKWLNCGVAWGGDVVSTSGPEGPGEPVHGTMLDVVDCGEVPAGYFLSPNAATGMLRRADRMGRKFLPALRRALERLAARGETGRPPARGEA